MRKGRLTTVSVLSLTCVGLCLLAGQSTAVAAGASPTKLGPPYEAGGIWFVPAADPSYDEEGLAAEYGAGQAGRFTASGERFDPRALTAGHATLPMPGVVEVTNLDTGKVITLRINDRGPYAAGRILSLTPASAEALGVAAGRSAHVRVRYADAGRRQAFAPVCPAARPVIANTAGAGFGVQVGAFGQRARADQVAAMISASGRLHAQVAEVRHGDVPLYRVTLGPLADAEDAQSARSKVSDLGFSDARVISAF